MSIPSQPVLLKHRNYIIILEIVCYSVAISDCPHGSFSYQCQSPNLGMRQGNFWKRLDRTRSRIAKLEVAWKCINWPKILRNVLHRVKLI